MGEFNFDSDDDIFSGGDSLFDDASSNTSNTSDISNNTYTEEDSADAKKKRTRKLICYGFIGVGLAILLIVLCIIGSKGKDKYSDKNKTDTGKNTSQNQIQTQQNTEVHMSNNNSSGDGWTSLNKTDMTWSEQNKSVFRVTNIEYFAKKTGSDATKLEMKATATGSIDGLHGTYSLDIPWRVTDRVAVGSELTVYYYICEVDGNRFVVDISYEK